MEAGAVNDVKGTLNVQVGSNASPRSVNNSASCRITKSSP